MKATYWEKGESLDYVNSGATVIEAGSIIDLKTRIAVAGASINPKERGSVHVVGVYQMAKKDTAEIAFGADVYYAPGEGITTAADNGETGDAKVVYTPVGYAAEQSAAEASAILVKLQG